jgi:cytochrome d ubiquinol oxidase subunit I
MAMPTGDGREQAMGAMAHVLAASPVPARSQMGSSLGFHIILACFGIAFPAVIMTAEWIGIKRGDPAALLLARRWSKVMAVLVAVGAVSGTVLSYEMGLLWPGLMGRYGAALGIPFSLEGIFFFLEAIFVGVYLYGWQRLPPWVHWWSGMPIVVAGLLGAVSVVAANSWMNSPAGYTMTNGKITSIDPVSVFFNASTPYETTHMVLAAYMVTGFMVAGVYAVGLLRGRRDRYHRLGFAVPFAIAGIAAPLQVMMGDVIARFTAAQQPVKFAAMEYVSNTTRDAPEWLGGIFINGHVYFGTSIPAFDSILVGFSPHTQVIGWNSVPPDQRPPLVTLIHLSFDLMVGIGTLLFALAAWQAWWSWFHRRLLLTPWFLVPAALSGVAAVAAMESGWIVTEVGRQPWIVYRVLLVTQAVTPSSGVPVTLGVILALYAVLTVASIGAPMIMSRRWRRETPTEEAAEQVPYGPAPADAPAEVPAAGPAAPGIHRDSAGGAAP